MINYGGIIERMVTPKLPGSPELDELDCSIQWRLEFVSGDPEWAQWNAKGRLTNPEGDGIPTLKLKWTTKRVEAFHYPRHLDAEQRAAQIGHCHVCTATSQAQREDNARQQEQILNPLPSDGRLSGGDKRQTNELNACERESQVVAPLTPRANGRTEYRGKNRAGSGGSAPPTQTHLPVPVLADSDRGGENPQDDKIETSGHEARESTPSSANDAKLDSCGGQKFSKRKQPTGDRLSALRAARDRTAPKGTFWWQEGQMA